MKMDVNCEDPTWSDRHTRWKWRRLIAPGLRVANSPRVWARVFSYIQYRECGSNPNTCTATWFACTYKDNDHTTCVFV